MHWPQLRQVCLQLSLVLALLILRTSPLQAAEYHDDYDLPTDAPAIDVAVHPLSHPTGLIGAVMRRDRLLRSNIKNLGLTLNFWPFRKGADQITLMIKGRLEAGPLGDMPAISVASQSDVVVAGVIKRSSNSLIMQGDINLQQMKGKRIGYAPETASHHTLLQSLNAAGLREQDVVLVPLGIDEMPGALAQNRIDGFSAWEPATTLALAQTSKNHVVFRSQTATYFILTQKLVRQHPQASLQLVTAYARAIEWMRRSNKNLETAARWVIADGDAFFGKPSNLSVPQAMEITRRELLSVPSAPLIQNPASDVEQMRDKFEFLRQLGKLAPGNRIERINAAFEYDALKQIYANPAKHHLYQFDYDR